MVQQFRIGYITSTHGLKGEVKVMPTTDDPERFVKGMEVTLDGKREQRKVKISGVRYFKQFVLLTFEGMDRIEDVQTLKGYSLLVDRSQAIDLEEGEYFIPDLIGMKVSDEEGNELGTLTDVLFTGANDVYVVHREGKRDLLLPNIPDCVLAVDVQAGTMRVHVLPGLEDL